MTMLVIVEILIAAIPFNISLIFFERDAFKTELISYSLTPLMT